MQNFRRWLRGFGIVGNALANILQVLTANLGVALTAAGGILAAIWFEARQFFLDPAVQVGMGVFLALLWTWIGITTLRDRKKPRVIRAESDYAYGLTYEGFVPVYEPRNEEAALQFGLQLRNYSTGPIRYSIETFDVRIEDRALPRFKSGSLSGYLARGAGRTSRAVPFKRESIISFFGKRMIGSAEVAITYGHPMAPPVRRLKISLELTLVFNDPPPMGFIAAILDETDEPFTQ